MKLPKPGNVKLPKPGKVKLPKLGKMPGNLKLPAFHMKSGFLKKNLLTLIAAAVLVIGTGTAYGTLATREADRGYDPIEGVNQDRYQVLVSGEGYKLSKIQERNYKLQKKQNEVNAAQAAQNAMNNPTTIRTSSGSRVYRTSNYRYRYRGSSSYSTSGTVFISTNIYSQKSTKLNWRAGDEFSFMVTAYTYKNGKKNTVSKDNIKVTSDKGTLKHTGSKDGNQYYVLKLAEGTNKITVTAKDKNSKKKSKNSYTITAGKKASSSTDPTKKPTKPTKPTNTDPTNPTTTPKPVSVDYGFGTLDSDSISLSDSTTAYDVLSRTDGIAMENKNVVSVSGDMSEFSLDGYNQDKLKTICKREAADDIEDDKDKHNDDIGDKLAEEYLDDHPDATDAEIDEYVNGHFDKYYEDHYFNDFFDKWKKGVEEDMQGKSKIENGQPFKEFKWTYNKDAKGKDVASNINLRLILE